MFVLKLGGSILDFVDPIIDDLRDRMPLILVHGIGPQVNGETHRQGKEPTWVTSASGIRSRYTDENTIEIFRSVCMRVNKDIATRFRQRGLNAVGLADTEFNPLHARRKSRIKVIKNGKKVMMEGDYTGKISEVDGGLLRYILGNGRIPVIAPLALGGEKGVLNVNGDRAAAHVATELRIDTILNLSNVQGVLRNGEVIPTVHASELEALREDVSGGMKMKLLGVQEALQFGIKKVIIASGTVEMPITRALAGEGTVFTSD